MVLLPSGASGQLRRTGTPAVEFSAAGPAGLKIDGKTDALDVAEADATITIRVGLAQLDTGIALRNKHMREKHLETDKYPFAELVVPRSSLQQPQDGDEVTTSVTAPITIHGRTKPVSIRYRARRAGTTYEVQGTTRVNMKEFGIDVPSYLGVTVKPDVEITVRFSMLDS